MFDSPLFWIVVIWWLASTLLGAKARKRRRAAQRLAEQELEPAADEWQPEAPAGEPAYLSEEEPGDEFVRPPVPLPPPRKRPVTPLQEIFRALGMEETPPLFGGMTAEVEPEPPPPEPEPPKIVAEVPQPPAKPDLKPRPVVKPSQAYLSIPVAAMRRLTPWQQAVVLKEILGTPPGLRSGTR
ncbi:MAG: hypothetical protein V3W14_09855 [Candidatus Neomarinimicrobiota bacterium]